MKKTILTTLAAIVCLGSIHARTWTSADGSKTFNAKYVSHTDEYVTVAKGLKESKFKISLLSEADREWLAAKAQKASSTSSTSKDALDLGSIGNGLKGNMVMLKDGKYKDYAAESAPEYYIVYYTASW